MRWRAAAVNLAAVNRNALLSVLCWCVYSGLVLACAAHHEPWFDEGQSWLLARDSSLRDLVFHRMRYEGTPPLWQIILVPFAKLGFPYVLISFISSSFAIIAVAIILWRAPFPFWMRMAIPFSYFVLFQYAVVARSYALLLPLLVGIGTLYLRRLTQSPRLYCALLCLLATVSLHAAFIAAVLIVEWLWGAYRTGLRSRKKALVFGWAMAFATLYLLMFAELRLPPDLVSLGTDPAQHAGLNRSLSLLSEAFFGGLGNKLYTSASIVIGCIVLFLFTFWFRPSRACFLFPAMILPTLLIAAFRQSAPWHSGVVFVAWVFGLWIYFLEVPEDASHNRPLLSFVAVILSIQVIFGLLSVRFDWGHTYSGSRELAHYLKDTGEEHGNLYALGFKSFAVQPYFSHNLFSSQENGRREAFYVWNKTLDHNHLDLQDIRKRAPERIILGIGSPETMAYSKMLESNGYCEEKRFPGGIWWKNGIAEPDTYILLRHC